VVIICALGPGNSFHEPSGSTNGHTYARYDRQQIQRPRPMPGKVSPSKMQLVPLRSWRMVRGYAFSQILSINNYFHQILTRRMKLAVL
jgi:hypothetical protein